MDMYQPKVLVGICVFLVLWPESVYTIEGFSDVTVDLPPSEWKQTIKQGYAGVGWARAEFANTLSTQFIKEIDTKFEQCEGSQQCLVLHKKEQSDVYKICKVTATCLPHGTRADNDDVIPDAAGRRGSGNKPTTKSSECQDRNTGNESQSCTCTGLAIGMLVLGMLLGSVTMAIVCVFVPSLHRKATHTVNKSPTKTTQAQWSRMPSTRSQTDPYVDAAITPSPHRRVTSPIEQPTYQEVDQDNIIAGHNDNTHMGYKDGQGGYRNNERTGNQSSNQSEYQDIEPAGNQYNEKKVHKDNKQLGNRGNMPTGYQDAGQIRRGNQFSSEAGDLNATQYDEGEDHVYSELGQRQQDVYSELGDDPRKIQNAELGHDMDKRDDGKAFNDATNDASNPDGSTPEVGNYFVLEPGITSADDGRDGAGEEGGTNILNEEQPHYFKLND